MAIVLLPALGFFIAGCSSQSPTVQTKVQVKEGSQRSNQVKAACELLQNATQLGSFREGLQLLNEPLSQAVEYQLDAELRKYLKENAHLSDDELEEVEAPSFRPLDAAHLESTFFFRDIARSLTLPNVAPVDQARHVFDWTMRRVLLHAQADDWLPPAQVLRRGYGSVRDRALVFLDALRPFQLQGCVLAPTGPPDVPFGTFLVGVLIPARGEQKPHVAIFDPRLGIPVTAPDGKSIATFEQIIAQPELLKRSQIPAESVAKLQVYSAFPLSALAPRMKFVEEQDGLADPERPVLYIDPRKLERDLEQAVTPGTKILVWNAPGGEKGLLPPSPLRIVRFFLPPDEGGLDRSFRKLQAQRHLVPSEQVYQHFVAWKLAQFLPPQALPRLDWFIQQLFQKFFMEPEELFLRGKYDETIARIQRIDDVLTAEEFATPLAQEEFQRLVAEWREHVRAVYSELGKGEASAKVESIWTREDLYLLNVLSLDSDVPLSRYPKGTLSHILIAACKEPLGQQARYLFASCWHEKAHSYLARAAVPTLAGKTNPAAAQDARHAWSNARAAWTKYLDRHGLGGQALRKRLDEIRDRRNHKEWESLVLLWEFLHADMHAWLEARLNLAEVHQKLENVTAAAQTLDTLLKDVASLEKSADREKQFAADLELIRQLGQTHWIRRMEMLASDWQPEGAIHWLKAVVDLRRSK